MGQAASRARSGSVGVSFALARGIAVPGGGAGQRCDQFNTQLGKITLDPTVTADQHMIVRGEPLLRQQFAQQRAKSPLHPVADHRVADFLGDSDAIAHRSGIVGPDQQHEAGPCDAQAPVGG